MENAETIKQKKVDWRLGNSCYGNKSSYLSAWQKWEKLGNKINQLWKTKKNSQQILREERS